MSKGSGAFLALGLMLLPATVWAQKPSGNVWTRSAEVYLDQAIKQTAAPDKTRFFNQAIEQETLAMQKDPSNPFAWQLAGRTYIAMGDAAKADSMFDRAETLYPPYVQVDAPFREQGWIDAYNNGVRALQANKMDEAIHYLQTADMVYQGRPSARMTLASIYLNRQEYDKAIEEYKGALAILQGPNGKNLKPDQQKQWQENLQKTIERLGSVYMYTKKFNEAAALFQQQVAANPGDISLKLQLARAQALGGNEEQAKGTFVEVANSPNLDAEDYVEAGAALFRGRDFTTAATAFRKATAANPQDHAAIYNLAQVLIVQIAPLDEELQKAAPAARAATVAKMQPLAEELGRIAASLLEVEPASTAALTLAAQAARIETDLATEPKARTAMANKALSVLQRRDSLKFEVSDVNLVGSADGNKLTGTITNKKLAAGAPIAFKVFFLAKDGSTLEAQDVSVPAPAKEQTVDFTAATKSKDAVGWKYTLGQ